MDLLGILRGDRAGLGCVKRCLAQPRKLAAQAQQKGPCSEAVASCFVSARIASPRIARALVNDFSCVQFVYSGFRARRARATEKALSRDFMSREGGI